MCTTGTVFLTIAEAAGLLATTETRILMMLKKNELVGKLEDDGWHVDQASLHMCGKPKPADFSKMSCGGGCGGCAGA